MAGFGRARGLRAGWSVAVAAVATAAACSSAHAKPGGTATVPTAPPTTADPWAVPATITAPYVDRVLAELNHIDGNAIRSARAANAITPEFIQLEMSIRATPALLKTEEALWTNVKSQGWTDIAPSPGDRRSNVLTLMTATPACISARVKEDVSAEGPGGIGVYPKWWVALLPKPRSLANPTYWAFIYDGYDSTGGAPKNACAGY